MVSHQTKIECKYHMTKHILQYSVTMASKKQHGARTLEQDLLTANSSGSIAGKKMTSTKSPFLLKDLNDYLDP